MLRRGGMGAAFVAALALAFAALTTITASAARTSIPATTENFLGLGTTQGGCVWNPKPPGGEPAGCVTTGDPPDTTGAAGPDNYVELDNGGIGIFDKSGTLLQTPVYLNTIWAGFPTTDGNSCAAGFTDNPAGNWGDPIVRYDQLANRWLVSEFDLPNYNNSTGPSFECVAVSKTSDPTGAWNLYDFKYNAEINDYPKFGIWSDGYYVTYNEFNPNFVDSRICALDRTAMLAGQTATQQCFTSTTFGLLPANVDGSIPPPSGTPEYVAALGTNQIHLYKFHVDWATPANSTFTGPTNLTTLSFSEACNGGNCIPQPSPGNALESVGDRLMDRLVYRNFGTHESLLVNHSVTAGTAVGVRWYEVRSPGGTPSIYQQGTYAPNDGSSRWMGSIAMDQAGDIALGYSKSSSTVKPSIAYTGRLASDTLGQMPQGEGIIATGGGVETGLFSNTQPANRWGDYSSMTVDPSDDCTFWYANELYPSNGIFNWDTRVGSFKFPNCAANDFSIASTPTSVAVPPGGSNHTTISTTLTRGTAETVQLTAFDLPPGVTASFLPPSVTAGNSSTLTFNATAGATPGTYTVQLVGTAASALHGTTVTVVVAPTHTLTVSKSGTGSGTVTSNPAGIDCGSTCSTQFASGTAVTLTATPATGSTFTGWMGGGCSGTGTCQVTLNADTTVTATFALQTKTLAVATTGTGSGSVSSNPAGIDCGSTCSHAYDYGTSVTLTATPATGSTFTGWTGACTGTGTCQLTMDADKTATATFGAIPETLTVAKAGTGSGSVSSTPAGIDCGSTCSHAYDYGTSVTLTATPATGSTFTGWTGACTGTGTCQLTMDADKTATATFGAIPETLTVAKAGTGSGSVSSTPAGIDCGATCSHAYDYGTSVTLTATPATGSTFTGWTGACSGTGTCTVSMTDARSVTAGFGLPNVLPKCVVPKLKGKTLAQAKRALKKAHCALGKVKRATSTQRKGLVIAQKPKPGKRLANGARVSVTLSKGP